MKQIRVSAPGKLNLLGEHAVVYGKPAIIVSVARRCTVTLTPSNDGVVKIISRELNVSQIFTEKEILEKSNLAQKKWKKFTKTNDIQLLKSITSGPLDYAAIIIGETLGFTKKKLPSGFSLTINSKIPINSGMGSSSALAVSVVGSVLLFLGEKFDKEKINNIAFLAEQKKHGNPSGGDNSACCFGGLIWFRKETPDLKIISQIPFNISGKISQNFLIVFTGAPEESTGEMVSIVRNLYQKRTKFTKKIFAGQELLVRELLPALKKGEEDTVRKCIRLGEKNLERLGVVSAFAKSLIRKIEKIDGAAKICGAGGKTKGAGIILAYHKNLKELEDLLQSLKIDFSSVSLGAEGIRQEL